MKTIVQFDTAIASSNLGDEIILASINQNMNDIFSKGTVVRLGTHVANFGLAQMLRQSKKVRFCQNADWKFICGTNLFTQRMIGRINPQWQINPVNLPIYKNCIFIGVGATDGGEKLDPYAQFLYRSVLSKQYQHSVRDEMTKRMLHNLGVKAINTGCPTLWMLTEDFCQTIPRKKAPDCILTVSGYFDQCDMEKDQIMIDILRANYQNLWAWIQTTEDAAYLSQLKHTQHIRRIYTLDNYRKVLKEHNVDYVGTRLHGGVFALQNRRRSFVVSIDHRAAGFHETNNLPIINRKDIPNALEKLIHSDFETQIRINQKAINRFRSQFTD